MLGTITNSAVSTTTETQVRANTQPKLGSDRFRTTADDPQGYSPSDVALNLRVSFWGERPRRRRPRRRYRSFFRAMRTSPPLADQARNPSGSGSIPTKAVRPVPPIPEGFEHIANTGSRSAPRGHVGRGKKPGEVEGSPAFPPLPAGRQNPTAPYPFPCVDSRRDAEEAGLSTIVVESPNGDRVHGCPSFRFPVSLRVSAPLREIITAWIRLRGGPSGNQRNETTVR